MSTRRKSPLVTIEKISPNKNIPRKAFVRRLTPHCVAGNLTVETTLGLKAFQSGGSSSTSYAIGSDGRRGLGVEETNRPWTSSSATNDHEAITFEIANNGGAPDWRMSDEAINSWLDLAVEIAKFYGYKKVNYQPKPSNITIAQAETWIKTWAKNGEMIVTLHQWFSNTVCPGPYFIRQIPWLVREMNRRLSGGVPDEAFIGEGLNSTVPSPNPTLRQGSTGETVKVLQTKLNELGATPKLVVDGSFGPLTCVAVQVFQRTRGLDPDGIVGPLTWGELNKNVKNEYRVTITTSALNVRSGPGANTSIVKVLINDKNVYTIVEEAEGIGATKWGRLKSGIGWISLDYTARR